MDILEAFMKFTRLDKTMGQGVIKPTHYNNASMGCLTIALGLTI